MVAHELCKSFRVVTPFLPPSLSFLEHGKETLQDGKKLVASEQKILCDVT